MGLNQWHVERWARALPFPGETPAARQIESCDMPTRPSDRRCAECRRISDERGKLEIGRSKVLFSWPVVRSAAREARPAITASRPFFAVRPAQPACGRRVRE